ncbi:MAG: GIY-YIG nuclease family protein [Desulfobacteraceae bacterium]|nr:MAG: GIY-YIG nuclease family protein [Desulfobacteraceae bacterium]
MMTDYQDQIDRKINEIEQKKGYVYVLHNETMKNNIFKIGNSKNDPALRAAQLSFPTGVGSPFKVMYHIEAIDRYQLENLVHILLNNFRINEKKEFFEIPPECDSDPLGYIISQMRFAASICNCINFPRDHLSLETKLNYLQDEINEIRNSLKDIIYKEKKYQ